MSAIILGFIVGIVFGLTGGGGGVLTAPFLIYGLDIPVHQSIGITLITLSFTAIVGLLKHSRSKKIDWHAGGVISAVGIIASWLGSRLNFYISDEILSLALAICLILISMMLWHNASYKSKEVVDNKRHYFKLCLIGIVAGFLNGLLGISGGVIVTTSLILFMSFSMRRAILVAMLVIAVNSTTSAFTHYYYLPNVISSTAIVFIASSMCGMVIASHFSNALPELFLKRGLAVVVFIIGMSMLVKYFLQNYI
jgi:uncharacterized membrane protein YfcA